MDTKISYRDPDRRDRPSTSKFSDYNECPAKYQYELDPRSEDKPNEWSAYGTEIHSAWSHKKEEPVTGDLCDERDKVLDSAERQVEQLVDDILTNVEAHEVSEVVHETRLWYPDELYSGRPDRVYILNDPERTAVIPDLKSLWGQVEPPAVNWQLRGTVPLVRHAFGSKRAVTAIIQPNREWLPPAFYNEKRLEQAEIASLQLIGKVDAENPIPIAGPHCARCNAQFWCPAALLMTQASALVTQKPKVVVPTLPDRVLERVYRYGHAAEKITKEAKSEMKNRVGDRPDDFPDWKLQTTGDEYKIGNLQQIFSELRQLFAIPEEGPAFDTFLSIFQSAMSLSLPALSKAIAKGIGSTESAMREAIEKRLVPLGLLVFIPKEKSLKEVNKWEIE
jgi:hypothetical protein